MKMTKLVPDMLDKSRFNHRLHQIGHYLKSMAGASEYVIDSFPVAGKQSSMRRYFYGVKVQALVNNCGIPVEFGFVPDCESDVQALKKLPLAVREIDAVTFKGVLLKMAMFILASMLNKITL